MDELRDALWDAPRIAFVRSNDGLVALTSVVELTRDLRGSRADMWEVALWEGALAADERETHLTFQVHNEAIVVPENIGCLRVLTGVEEDADRSIQMTDEALGVTKSCLPKSKQPIPHVVEAGGEHPQAGATKERFRQVGFRGAEEPTSPEEGEQQSG